MIITGVEREPELKVMKAKMLGSLLYFTQVMYKIRTGREFYVGNPPGREAHPITISRFLTKIFRLEARRGYINMPPRHGKSTFVTYFMAWAFAHYPFCNFIYISYSAELAAEHTAELKQIMKMPQYRKFFGVEIASDSSAKDNFKTTQGGSVKAFGSQGAITGQNAGLPNLNHFSGCVLCDDLHKPDEVHSDTIRESVIKNYNETIKPRASTGPNIPIISIGHRLHEQDIFAFWGQNKDGQNWTSLILPAIDDAGNLLAPHLNSKEMLDAERIYNRYVFASQYQQTPEPAGGGIFDPTWFVLLDKSPNYLITFITADTAETSKDYNDASVFSFWGLYEINDFGRPTSQYALHWIDCYEFRVEPCELEDEFKSFYSKCCDCTMPPQFAAIEKKSTGTTLASVLGKYRGLEIRNIERTKASGNKTSRFLEMQPYASRKLISMTKSAPHVGLVKDHMRKITANNTHAHDDIADTAYDAVKIALIDGVLLNQIRKPNDSHETLVKEMAQQYHRTVQVSRNLWQQ